MHKGSDVLKLNYLITDFVVKEQKDFTTTDSEISALQNKKNSSNYEFYKTLSEENKTDYVAGENTSNNEIQLGDLFEDFIRELEKENYESNGRVRKRGRRMRGV